MSDLYQEVIIDHAHAPRNRGCCAEPTHRQTGHNPLCGDQLDLTLVVRDDVVIDVQFMGEGCAISLASASLMTEAIKGKSLVEVQPLFDHMHAVLLGQEDVDESLLGKLSVLQGVSAYPMRVKCVTLAWHTLNAALQGQSELVSTEDIQYD